MQFTPTRPSSRVTISLSVGDSPPAPHSRRVCSSALNPYKKKPHLEKYSPYEIQSRNDAVRLNQ